MGAESICHAVLDGIYTTIFSIIRNPMPAQGGQEPEDIARLARRYAPEAFRTQERAVTGEDYAEISQKTSQIQRACAIIRWTGAGLQYSWQSTGMAPNQWMIDSKVK